MASITIISLLLLSLLTVLTLALPPPSRGNSVLIIGESPDTQTTHTRFLSALTDCGRTITFKAAAASSIVLYQDGEYLYDAVFLLAPHSSIQTRLPVSKLIEFIDSGRDLFVASTNGYSSYTEQVAEAIGVDLDDRSNVVIDHQHVVSDIDDGSHRYFRAGGWVSTAFLPVFATSAPSSASPSDIIFRGTGATLFKDNELVHALLWGSGSSFGRSGGNATAGKAHPALGIVPRVAGSGTVLAAAVCTRSGSRATWFGSMDALSDATLQSAGEEHARAVGRLAQWAVGEMGELRVKRVAHGRVEDGGAGAGNGGPTDYRVKDVIEFVIQVEMWDGARGEWVGFETDDMQVEFVMLNPWVRTRLQAEKGSGGIFRAVIQVPDQIGVYKFKVDYVRAGLSGIFMEKVVAVRPFLHNEYERFIQMASPYYAASLSMLLGVLLLGYVLLFGSNSEEAMWLSGGDGVASGSNGDGRVKGE